MIRRRLTRKPAGVQSFRAAVVTAQNLVHKRCTNGTQYANICGVQNLEVKFGSGSRKHLVSSSSAPGSVRLIDLGTPATQTVRRVSPSPLRKTPSASAVDGFYCWNRSGFGCGGRHSPDLSYWPE